MPPSVYRHRVRYHECDAQGVVFNAHYFTYFDVASTELWREALGSYAAMTETGVDVMVAEATARYRAPARFDEEIDIETSVAHLGMTSMITHIDVRRDGRILVEGEIRYVFVDTESYAKRPIPDDIREALEPFGASAELEGSR